MLSRQQREDFEIESIKVLRAYFVGERDDVNDMEIEPWEEERNGRQRLIDEKIIFEAFSMGALRAYKGCRTPPGFESALGQVEQELQMLLLATEKGVLRMSVREAVDKHMRLWVKNIAEINDWIKNGDITARAILRNACEALIAERKYYDESLREMKPQYKAKILGIIAEMEAEERGEKAPPPTPEKKQDDKQDDKKLPSGLHNSV